MSHFLRPESFKFPQTFATFRTHGTADGELIEYRIQDLPEDYFEAALGLLASDYMPDETFSACLGLHNSAGSVRAFRDLWREEMRSGLSIACFTNDDRNELVAVDVLSVYRRDSAPSFEQADPKLNQLYEILKFITGQCGIFERYGVDKFLTDQGLCTSRQHRHRGIAVEMLKARVPIMKALGIKVTSSDFSVTGSQKASEKAGFEEVWSMSYKDLSLIFPSVDFSNAQANRVITKVLLTD